MSSNQKLELTWIGKAKNVKIEPRILLLDEQKSYGKDMDNILIHGDNLLALRALQQEYTGKIKCIYIDPPFNTGSRINADGDEIGYEDGIEHSIWLNMMYQRLDILKQLLTDDGAIFVHLDDNEVDYCKVIMDEIFGRNNFMNRVTIDARSPSAFSTVNPGMFVAAEYILYYAKNRMKLKENVIKVARTPDYAYDKWIENIEDDYTQWNLITLNEAFEKFGPARKYKPETMMKKYNDFIINNAQRICRFTSISDSGAGQKILELKNFSIKNKNKIFRLKRETLDDIYILNGQQISFYSKNIKQIDGKLVATSPLTDIWKDIAWEGIANEGNVKFKKGKKPERLIKRCLELVTSENDIVLDSFLGSGTTAAVAHKMNRRWIGVELGNHCYSHCLERLKRVVDGSDQTGISKNFNWKGGGGFRFYELAPSLLKQDKYGNWIMNTDVYTASLVAAAVAKYHGFTYYPDQEVFWKQGYSYENDYIFTTDQMITIEYIDLLHSEMKSNESLLICCSAYQQGLEERYENINIQKIPQSILDKYDFGVENYNMDIDDSAVAEVAVTIDEEEDENE